MAADTLHINNIKSINNGRRIEAQIQTSDESFDIYFSTDDISLYPSPESFVSMAYPRCMKLGNNIRIDKPLDPYFISGLDNVYQFFQHWNKGYTKPAITVTPTTLPDSDSFVGSFFSGGLDSLYTFLSNKDEITHLIFVHGFDIKLENTQLREQTSEAIRYVASQFDTKVIEIETNLRHLIYKKTVNWGTEGHGAALAAIGHLLSHRFSKIFIPASYAEEDDFLWGSHKDLDKHWFSSQLKFIHHGNIESQKRQH